jgi:Zn-dependent peptidase ImmA (M78 family)
MSRTAAQGAFDLAKLDLILAQARERLVDYQIELVDVMTVQKAAAHFGVTEIAAHRRAKDLGLLSYQDAGRAALAPSAESKGETL